MSSSSPRSGANTGVAALFERFPMSHAHTPAANAAAVVVPRPPGDGGGGEAVAAATAVGAVVGLPARDTHTDRVDPASPLSPSPVDATEAKDSGVGGPPTGRPPHETEEEFGEVIAHLVAPRRSSEDFHHPVAPRVPRRRGGGGGGVGGVHGPGAWRPKGAPVGPDGEVGGSPGSVVSAGGGVRVAKSKRVLASRLARRRWLRQYFDADVLVREMSVRKITNDELFLDLVRRQGGGGGGGSSGSGKGGAVAILVATIAVLGHELRVAITWPAVEKFLLLFAVVWAVWRDAAFLFNTFGSTGDLLEKMFVFLTVLALCGIGVGAHSAFTSTATWVSACAFFSLFFIAATSALFGFREPRLRAASTPPPDDAATAAGRPPPRRSLRAVLATNFVVASAVVTVLTAVPYLAAAVVGTRSRRAVVVLYWVGALVNQSRASVFPLLYRKVVRRRPGTVMPAVNIEALTEKYGLLTLIVMGESLLAILFEGGTVLTLPSDVIDMGRLYASTLCGVAIAFSFKLLYMDVDNRVFRRGVHAIRWNRKAGIVWSVTHLYFHAALILSATGLGIILRAAAVRPAAATAAAAAATAAATAAPAAATAAAGEELLMTAVSRAGGGSGGSVSAGAGGAAGGAASTAADTLGSAVISGATRWVFSVGTFGALLLLVVLASTHKSGPRAATRRWRLPARAVIAIAGLLALPLGGDRLDPLVLLCLVAAVVWAATATEFVLIEADRIGWFRSELSATVAGQASKGTPSSVSDGSVTASLSVEDVGQVDGVPLATAKADSGDPEAGGGTAADEVASSSSTSSSSSPSPSSSSSSSSAAEDTRAEMLGGASTASAAANGGRRRHRAAVRAGGDRRRRRTVRAVGDGDDPLRFRTFAAGGGAGGCEPCQFL
ncbi:hypothetical protein MMPV_007699 [Pyropia vietnamensis]